MSPPSLNINKTALYTPFPFTKLLLNNPLGNIFLLRISKNYEIKNIITGVFYTITFLGQNYTFKQIL